MSEILSIDEQQVRNPPDKLLLPPSFCSMEVPDTAGTSHNATGLVWKRYQNQKWRDDSFEVDIANMEDAN